MIRKLRRAMDITQSELAMAMEVERSTVSKWEKGVSIPRGKTLIALANFFNVTEGEILKSYKAENGDDNEKDPNRFKKLHYLIPPNVFFFVKSLMKGVRRFIVRIAMETPSGYVPNCLIAKVRSPAPIQNTTRPEFVEGVVT